MSEELRDILRRITLDSQEYKAALERIAALEASERELKAGLENAVHHINQQGIALRQRAAVAEADARAMRSAIAEFVSVHGNECCAPVLIAAALRGWSPSLVRT